MNSSNWQVDEDGNPLVSTAQAKRQNAMSRVPSLTVGNMKWKYRKMVL